MKRVVVLVVMLMMVFTFALAGCAQQSTTEPSATEEVNDAAVDESTSEVPEEDTYTIGFLVPSFSNQGFVVARTAAEEVAEELGVELVCVGAQDETSIEEQIQCMEDLIARGVDAVVFSPASSTGIVDVLVKAQKAGILLVNFDSRVDADTAEAAGLEPIPYIGANNEEGAYLSAEYLVDLIGGEGKVCIIEGLPGHYNNEVRKAGAIAAFDAAEGIELVTIQAANWGTEEAMNVLTDVLTANPDIKGVFACNDTMAWGCAAAITAMNLTGTVRLTCFDGLMDTLSYVEDGTIDATLDQRLDEQGGIGVEYAVKLLNGEDVPESTDTNVRLWTIDSIVDIFPNS